MRLSCGFLGSCLVKYHKCCIIVKRDWQVNENQCNNSGTELLRINL